MKTAKITKTQTRDFVKGQLATNKVWALNALKRIFDFQTKEEKQHETTSECNGIGFTGVDGEILSSFAKQLIRRGSLSDKQMAIVYRKMPKYWNQIIRISDSAKLMDLVQTSLN